MKKIVLSILLLGTSAFPFSNGAKDAHAATLATLITRTRVILRDTSTNTNNQRYSDAVLTDFANEGQADIQKRTHCIYKRQTATTTEGTREYTLPSDFLEEKAVYIVNSDSTGTYRRLAYTTIDKLDKTYISWEDAGNGRPTEYYIRKTTMSTCYLGLYLEPDSDHAGVPYLRYDYIPELADMELATSTSTVADTPFNGVVWLGAYEDMIVTYMVYRCTRDPGYLAIYLQRMKDLIADMFKHSDNIIKIKSR